MLDAEIENDENLTVVLTEEEKSFLRNQKTGWIFFTPTDLLKKYLEVNARIIGFNVDPDFNNCLDGLIMLDVCNLPAGFVSALSKDQNGEEVVRRLRGSARSCPARPTSVLRWPARRPGSAAAAWCEGARGSWASALPRSVAALVVLDQGTHAGVGGQVGQRLHQAGLQRVADRVQPRRVVQRQDGDVAVAGALQFSVGGHGRSAGLAAG